MNILTKLILAVMLAYNPIPAFADFTLNFYAVVVKPKLKGAHFDNFILLPRGEEILIRAFWAPSGVDPISLYTTSQLKNGVAVWPRQVGLI